MKAFYCRILQGILLALLSAARGADNPPSVDSILDKFIEASGGKAAMEKIKSRTIKGDLELKSADPTGVGIRRPTGKSRRDGTID